MRDSHPFPFQIAVFTNFSSKSTRASKPNELQEQLKLGNVSLLNSNSTVYLPPATLETSNMVSGQTESSIFSKEGPSHHNKLPKNTQDITWYVATSGGFWSALIYLHQSIGTLDLIFSTRFSPQNFPGLLDLIYPPKGNLWIRPAKYFINSYLWWNSSKNCFHLFG